MSSALAQIGRNPIFRYGIIGIVLYIILFLIYEPITLGLDVEDLSILTIPTIVGMFLFQYFMGTTVFHRAFLGYGLVGILWVLTFPLLFHWSYVKPLYFYEFANDFLFGLLLFMGLSGLQFFISQSYRFHKVGSAILAILSTLLSLIPFIQIGYYMTTWHCLTPASLLALYMTNPEEAFGFLKNAAGIPGLVAIIIGFLLWIAFLYWCNLDMKRVVEFNSTRPMRKWILSLSLLSFLIYVPFYVFPQTCIIANWNSVADYVEEMQTYNDKHTTIYESFQLTTNETAAQKVPGTVILVIGESSSRDYMKVFNPEFLYDDTPWQSDMRHHNSEFIFYDNAYSSYVQTVPTLERALSERNQYDDRPFLDSANILDVAKKAGYKTSWFSNQGVFGEYDTAISLIAKTADITQWAHDSYAFSDQYDESVLPLLETVNPSENNFIVIHIMGSHIYYNDRYPSSFSKWKQGPYPEGLEAYANSQLYTDWVLQQIYNYGKEHLNLQAMVYFSDHGESLDKSHNPDTFDFVMAHIPLWVYLSPEYAATYPETVTTLKKHETQYFTNDLLYDTLVGILQAPSNRYDPSRDFSNPSYRFNVHNLTTLLGQEPLIKDPDNKTQ
ncbi:sulfatase-like hydrolase/transferase [Veillonella agrestimuris]|uniref:sulfatase-like hydrolase/transferase n=1 Tax=Veillonella agrestimuris TaxID=2941340 RepID=UPI0020425649|nr:phosphoethanolamine transferase [Veillonella agrestimuris]